ncbi:hypothetical protein SELMODRAFT_420892 [Selaginella moellendorffii]|uniref:Enkurin domain-containing protein n=1 Tax=Selaginella moellendorffii TaxID=88036 RepID=D8SDG2_SELML|nr:hypothetical protein SELMODRAFT_420892 [Selaginella moellendorffii]
MSTARRSRACSIRREESGKDSREILDWWSSKNNLTKNMMQRMGIRPHDHRRDNRAIISELSARSHAMKQIASDPEPPPVKPPRIRLDHPPRASVRSGETDFLSKNFKEAGVRRPPSKQKQKHETPEQKNNGNKNKESFGKIPAYLIRRKMELAFDAERKLLEEEAKSLPPGFVLMPDEEKQEVLKTLEENKVDLENKLRGLPLVIETPSLLRSKIDMDTQLRETEDAIKRFSRPKVYISLDDS